MVTLLVDSCRWCGATVGRHSGSAAAHPHHTSHSDFSWFDVSTVWLVSLQQLAVCQSAQQRHTRELLDRHYCRWNVSASPSVMLEWLSDVTRAAASRNVINLPSGGVSIKMTWEACGWWRNWSRKCLAIPRHGTYHFQVMQHTSKRRVTFTLLAKHCIFKQSRCCRMQHRQRVFDMFSGGNLDMDDLQQQYLFGRLKKFWHLMSPLDGQLDGDWQIWRRRRRSQKAH